MRSKMIIFLTQTRKKSIIHLAAWHLLSHKGFRMKSRILSRQHLGSRIIVASAMSRDRANSWVSWMKQCQALHLQLRIPSQIKRQGRSI
ncbi:hypothetical protein FGO68_gene14150 [Halteria grandinella]|uniref:Uncharacterized protein n=1 Tax=Halteria grandinella TaxID=5974 RepID=A0A8J8NYJ4_HALGN|nr:hypothetical protein FGO68_gene14150 [Halteria grandinella]